MTVTVRKYVFIAFMFVLIFTGVYACAGTIAPPVTPRVENAGAADNPNKVWCTDNACIIGNINDNLSPQVFQKAIDQLYCANGGVSATGGLVRKLVVLCT